MSVGRWLPERIEGRHVLAGLVGFFTVMLLANGIFVFFALRTFNGFATDDAYRKGLNYNASIAFDRTQAARGWRPALRYERASLRLVLEVRDRRGDGVSGLTISGRIGRPAADFADQGLKLREVAPAIYAAPVDLAPGNWTVAMTLFENRAMTKPAHRLKQRLWVERAK
jgi:nitrogen fixation protein FixH